MRYRMISLAAQDIVAAIEYYNTERSGLGIEFAVEVRNALERIRQHPFAWRKIDYEIRECLLDRFPYVIDYRIATQEIVILAVQHLKRRPGAWRDRLGHDAS